MTLFTQEKMRALIDAIADGHSMKLATAHAYGSRSKVGWTHLRNARRDRAAGISMDDSKFVLRDWPQEGEHHWLDHAFEMATQIAKMDLHLAALEEIRHATRPVIEGGRVQYEVDEAAIAAFKDAETARDLGGLDDWPYRHDAKGARIPLRVRDRPSAQLLIAALKAMLPDQWNVPEKSVVEKKISGFLTVGTAPAAAAKSETSLVKDLRTKLAALREKGPQNPRPNAAVRIEGRGSGNDPPEKISNTMGDDVQLPRGYGLETVRVEPPAPPAPDYRRKATNKADAANRPLRSNGMPVMPPGGYGVFTGRRS